MRLYTSVCLQTQISSSFFLLLLATRLFHIFSDIWFWPNLVTVTETWTTTHAQAMMGSEVMMGSLWSRGRFHKKGIKSFRMRSMDAWLMHMHYLDPFYKSYYIKNSSVVTWGHRGQKVIFTKKAPSPTECVALMRDSCICISLTPSTKVIALKIIRGHLGSQGSKGHFH